MWSLLLAGDFNFFQVCVIKSRPWLQLCFITSTKIVVLILVAGNGGVGCPWALKVPVLGGFWWVELWNRGSEDVKWVWKLKVFWEELLVTRCLWGSWLVYW